MNGGIITLVFLSVTALRTGLSDIVPALASGGALGLWLGMKRK